MDGLLAMFKLIFRLTIPLFISISIKLIFSFINYV